MCLKNNIFMPANHIATMLSHDFRQPIRKRYVCS